MHGQLTARSVADVCRELAEASATGVLHIAGPEASGRLVFDQGGLVAATSPTPGSRLGDRLVNGGLLDEADLERVLDEQRDTPESERQRLGQLLVDRGLVPIGAVRLVVQEQLLDAVFELTAWRDGTYRFEHDAEPDLPEVPLSVPVDQALVEVSRRREEWAALTEVIPDLDAVPRFREGASTSTADLEPDEFAVMASIDGNRSVRDLAYDLGYGEFEAARVVYGLCLLGLVEVESPVDEIGAALDDALAYVSGGAEPATASSQQAPAVRVRGEPAAPAGDEPTEPARAERAEPGPADPQPPPQHEVDEPEPWSSLDASWNDVVGPSGSGEPAAADPEPTPPAGRAPDAAPTPADDEETLEADLPDLSGFEELRIAERHEPAAPPEPPVEEPPAAPAPPEPPTRAGPPDRSGRPTADADGDVSEFLRELSRLALDDPEEAEEDAAAGAGEPASGQPPARPRPRPASESREEPRRKKRGLFGFGG